MQGSRNRNPGLISILIIQQTLIGLMGLAFAVAVFRQGGIASEIITSKLQLVLVAYAIGILIQIFNFRIFGSGLFLPPISSAIYVQPSILALSFGGMPLLIGMTMFAGFCEIIFSFIIRYTRFIVPPETCGLVILLVGLELAFSGISAVLHEQYLSNIVICAATITPIVALSVWSKGYLRHLSTFFGVVIGGLMTYLFQHDIAFNTTASVAIHFSFFQLPNLLGVFSDSIHFDGSLIITFLLVGFAASIRSLGLALGIQQFESKKWTRPNYPPLTRAMRSDGLTAMLAGLFGTPGLNISPTSTTMAIAARCTDVLVGVGMSILFLILSCFPRFLQLISNAPLAIVGAILIYYASYIFTGGIRLIGAQAFGIKQVFSIGIPFCLAVGAATQHHLLKSLPPIMLNFFGSPLSIGIVSAIILNIIFHLGSFRRNSFILTHGDHVKTIVCKYFYNYGEAWALKHDMVEDAIAIATEVVEQIKQGDLASSAISVTLVNESGSFTMKFSYIGEPYKLQSIQKIDPNTIYDEETFIAGLKIYLRGTYPEEISCKIHDNKCEISMRFNYY